MATHPRTCDVDRETDMLAQLTDLARAGRPLPHARELSRMVGLLGGNSGMRVLQRLAAAGRVTVDGHGKAKAVHITDPGLTITAAGPRHSVEEIVAAVAATSGMTADDVTGLKRTRLYLRPRFLAVMLARKEGWSYPTIGRVLGRDHSTIIHATWRAEQLLERDPLFARLHRRAVDALAGVPPSMVSITPRAPGVPAAPPAPAMRHPLEIDREDRAQVTDLSRRRRGADALLKAIRREHPERCAA